MGSSTQIEDMTQTERISTAIERGKRVLRLEMEALAEAESRLGRSFGEAVYLISECTGRVIVCGVGKSGLIARKIAATMTSTGTPAFFLHPVEGAHGDLGIVTENDVAILLSKSGETDEIISVLEPLKRFGVKTVAITGNINSTLGANVDVALDGWVAEEACPHDLAPTTSTTVALAIGDAIAIALLEAKGFRAEDFARLHPGGSLGRKMLTRVRDVMVDESLSIVSEDSTMRDAIIKIASQRGLAIVTNKAGFVLGVITAGDLTRLMRGSDSFMDTPVSSVMNPSPKLAHQDEMGSAVVHRMQEFGIIAMPVIDGDNKLVGVVHLHDLMRAGAI